MAPEILLCMDYSELVDVFSFGMILAELISRAVPSGKIFKRVIPGFGLNPVFFFKKKKKKKKKNFKFLIKF